MTAHKVIDDYPWVWQLLEDNGVMYDPENDYYGSMGRLIAFINQECPEIFTLAVSNTYILTNCIIQLDEMLKHQLRNKKLNESGGLKDVS